MEGNAGSYTIAQEGPDAFIVSTTAGRHFTVNKRTCDVLKALDGTSNVGQAYANYCRNSEPQLDRETFGEMASHLLSQLNSPPPPSPTSYLRWKWELLDGERLAASLQWLTPLWRKKIFWPLLLMMFALAISVVIVDFGRLPLLRMPLFFWLALPLTTFIHELGHLLAAHKLGARPGNIGLGLYIFIPVFYTDVSDSWRLRRLERVTIDLSGVYLEGLFATVLLLCGRVTASVSLVTLAVLLFVRILAQMIPFVRKDGYWVLSDLAKEPNLLKRSRASVRTFGRQILQLRAADALAEIRSEWLRILYGLANAIVIALVGVSFLLFVIRQVRLLTSNWLAGAPLLEASLVPRQLLGLLVIILLCGRIVRALTKRHGKKNVGALLTAEQCPTPQ